MKRISGIPLMIILAFFALNLLAQKKKNDKKQVPVKAAYSTLIPVYLGHSQMTGGAVPKREFDSLLKQGIVAIDSAGISYKIVGFRFNYAERNLYEDSVGNLMPLTDYMLEYCPGNNITSNIAAGIYDRTKEGDTVYFDEINLIRPDEGAAAGRPMKFEITK